MENFSLQMLFFFFGGALFYRRFDNIKPNPEQFSLALLFVVICALFMGLWLQNIEQQYKSVYIFFSVFSFVSGNIISHIIKKLNV